MTVLSFRGCTQLTACIAVLAALAGCGSSPTSPTTGPFTKTDVRIGSGLEAAAGNLLMVHYTGWLYDAAKPDMKGVQFESSVGGTPFPFTLGAGQVIAGWDLGIPGEKVGGLRRLVIPPSLAYGAVRNGPIPPNATLVFEIEVVDVLQAQ